MNLKKNHYSRRALALLLTLVMCVGMIPTAFAAQQNSYHDPAEHWMQASGRTNELDANSVVTRETFKCGECGKATSFEVFRVPEYTRNGQPALSRNVKYSDGTMVDGVGKGDTMDGIPGKDATYTGYHYTKAVCETCGGINTNMSKSEYGYLKNVYWLYDCAAAFTQELDETVSYEYTDDTYHTVTTKGGTYCAFCYGTNHTVSRKLERHSMVTEVLPQPANGRFATVEKCSLCDYARYDYTAAKAVIADYYGVVDGKPHTITVSDLSEAGVRTSIRYGNSADSCTMTSAPNYTEAGQYMVYYEITYTYKGKEMTENGVAKVWLRDESTKDDGSCACGCGDPNCGCQNKNCNGNCCTDKGCGENHKYILLDSTKAGCTTLGYDRYLCTQCGKIEKRDYVDSLGHAWQSIVIRDATCEADGKQLELCSRCGQMKQTATPKGEHSYEVYTVAATCTSPGYTVRECSVCGDRHIEDITAALPHNYESHVIAATCENGGKTIHRCDGCGSSFVTDYTDSLGHSWDIITVDGMDVEVPEDVYLAYAQADRRERYIMEEQSSGKLLSLEQMEEDALLPDYVGAETAPSAETEALEREELRNLAEQKQILLLALLSLKDTDRELINALFFDGASTREYAQRMGVSQRAVIKRRDRILRDLKKFFENSSK